MLNHVDSRAINRVLPPKPLLRSHAHVAKPAAHHLAGHAAAAHLLESPLAQDQTVEYEHCGWVVLQGTVPDTQQLLWWLLGFGDQVEVLEPIRLREKIVKSLQRQRDLYGLNNPRSESEGGDKEP